MDSIMTEIYRATVASDQKVKVAGLQCLAQSVKLHYELMGPALVGITLENIKSDVDEVKP